MIFIGARHETTMCVAWALSILAQLPDLQDAIRAEAEAAAPGRPVAPRDDLPIAARGIEETMRLYPPAPATGRMPVRPTRIG